MSLQLHSKTHKPDIQTAEEKEAVEYIEISCTSCVFFSKITASDKGVCYNIHSEKILEVVGNKEKCEKFMLIT